MRNPEKISARRRALLGERAGSFAEAKFLRMSATKVRRVIDLVRGQDANTALAVLRFAPQAAAVPARKALESAIANAVEQEGLDAEDLYISAVFADEGVTLRRIKPRAKGSASRILKRGAHLTVVVEPKPEPQTPAKKADAKKADAKKADAKKADAEKADAKKADAEKADGKKADDKKADQAGKADKAKTADKKPKAEAAEKPETAEKANEPSDTDESTKEA